MSTREGAGFASRRFAALSSDSSAPRGPHSCRGAREAGRPSCLRDIGREVQRCGTREEQAEIVASARPHANDVSATRVLSEPNHYCPSNRCSVRPRLQGETRAKPLRAEPDQPSGSNRPLKSNYLCSTGECVSNNHTDLDARSLRRCARGRLGGNLRSRVPPSPATSCLFKGSSGWKFPENKYIVAPPNSRSL